MSRKSVRADTLSKPQSEIIIILFHLFLQIFMRRTNVGLTCLSTSSLVDYYWLVALPFKIPFAILIFYICVEISSRITVRLSRDTPFNFCYQIPLEFFSEVYKPFIIFILSHGSLNSIRNFKNSNFIYSPQNLVYEMSTFTSILSKNFLWYCYKVRFIWFVSFFLQGTHFWLIRRCKLCFLERTLVIWVQILDYIVFLLWIPWRQSS